MSVQYLNQQSEDYFRVAQAIYFFADFSPRQLPRTSRKPDLCEVACALLARRVQ